MRTYNLNFLVDREENITFRSIYAHIDERENGLFCSLEGEFFKKDQRYDPPMTYEMSNVGVTTRDINTILREKYHFLLLRDYPDLAKSCCRRNK